MKPVSYFDFTTCEGIELYCEKARNNVELFNKILGTRADVIGEMLNFDSESLNFDLITKIAKITGLSRLTIKGINVADEVLNLNHTNLFGCTSVGIGSKIGQTLDLFTLDLCVVREPDALYVTMPPYLTLMGIGKHLAFVTNFLSGPVRANGIPISHMRRELLRRNDLDEAVKYLTNIQRSNTVNFLMVDENRILNVETSPDEMLIHEQDSQGFLAHTNHFVKRPFTEDTSCPRLTRANQMLKEGSKIKHILEDKNVFVPISPLNEDYGFGSIIQVEMDAKNKTLAYKDSSMSDYVELRL